MYIFCLCICELFFLTVALATQEFSCSLGIPCIYDTQIKGCSRCRNTNYRFHSLGSLINDLLYATFAVCVEGGFLFVF